MGEDLPQVVQLDEFQNKANEFWDNSLKPRDQFMKLVLRLNGETGNIAAAVGASFYGKIEIPADAITMALGQVLNDVAVTARLLGLDLSDVATAHLRQLDMQQKVHVDADVEVAAV